MESIPPQSHLPYPQPSDTAALVETMTTEVETSVTKHRSQSHSIALENDMFSTEGRKKKRLFKVFHRDTTDSSKLLLSASSDNTELRNQFSLGRMPSSASLDSTASTLTERRHLPFQRSLLRRRASSLSFRTTSTAGPQENPTAPSQIEMPSTSTSSRLPHKRSSSSLSDSISSKQSKSWLSITRPTFSLRRRGSSISLATVASMPTAETNVAISASASASAGASASASTSTNTDTNPSTALEPLQEPSRSLFRRRYSRWQNRLRTVSLLRNGAFEHWERLIANALVGPDDEMSASTTSRNPLKPRGRNRSRSSSSVRSKQRISSSSRHSTSSFINSGGVRPMFWFWFFWCCFFSAIMAFGLTLGILGSIGARWSGLGH